MHILKAQQFDKKSLDEIFELTDFMKSYPNSLQVRKNLILASLFYEASTRTRFSFESAMLKLGGSVISTENAQEFSSAAKAKISSVPIINAGDGSGQHPTQSLIDLYTIQKECGEIDGKTIALIGDLSHSRTIHSLAYMLTKYAVSHIYLVAPDFIQMKPELIQHFDKHNVSWSTSTRLKDVAADVDVFYQTRLQKERFKARAEALRQLRTTAVDLYTEYQKIAHRYKIDGSVLELMKSDARILHPLPRLGEIAMEVDADPRAAYFRQARNGLYIRKALLLKVLNKI